MGNEQSKVETPDIKQLEKLAEEADKRFSEITIDILAILKKHSVNVKEWPNVVNNVDKVVEVGVNSSLISDLTK